MPNAHDLAVPRSRVATVRNVPAGSRAHVQLSGGDCAAHMVFAGFNRRTGTATYALRFVNQSTFTMSARMFCVTRRGEAIPAYPLPIDIAPFSIKDTIVPVRIADVGPYDRALVEVEGGGVAFSVDAPAPPALLTGPARLARWGAAAAVTTIIIALAAAAGTPRLPVLAAPSRALAGQRVDIPYVREGWGSLHYDLSTADGRQISAGMARERQGVLHVALPNSAISQAYVLHVHARGPLGSVERSATLMALAPPQTAPVKSAVAAVRPSAVVSIDSMSVSPTPVLVGKPLKVSYVTNAVAGDVWLIDANGRSWARASLRTGGVTWLHVPVETAGREMRVVVHARGANGDATSTVGVMVASGGDAIPASAGARDGRPISGAPALDLSKETVPSGYMFAVRMTGSSGAFRVALTDATGRVIAQTASASGGAVRMAAPHVRSAATYYVIATITQGSGEQSLVRKIIVVPHPSRP